MEMDSVCVLFMVKYISFGLRINRKLFFFTLPFLSFFSIKWAEEARHLSWGWNTRPSAWDWSLGSRRGCLCRGFLSRDVKSTT